MVSVLAVLFAVSSSTFAVQHNGLTYTMSDPAVAQTVIKQQIPAARRT